MHALHLSKLTQHCTHCLRLLHVYLLCVPYLQSTARQYAGEAQQRASPYIEQGKQQARYVQERTLVSQLVRYSLLLESSVLTAWGFYHFFLPAQAAQWSFPSTVTNWPHCKCNPSLFSLAAAMSATHIQISHALLTSA